MQRAVLLPPVVVVVRVAEPCFQQPAVVFGIAANLSKIMKSLRARYAADARTFMTQAQARIDHVRAVGVRRLGHGQKILRVASLRAAECADAAGAPALPGEPLA